MLVRDLEPGCLLLPDKKYWWNVSDIRKHENVWGAQMDEAVAELELDGISHSGTIQYDHFETKRRITAVYIGAKVLRNYYLGVKKQHIVLVENVLCVMDGYQFTNCKKL